MSIANNEQQAIVNGINVEALRETIATVSADPDCGQTNWSVTSRWNEGTRTDHHVDGVTIGGKKVERQFKIEVDEPFELCGTNDHANPQEYLIAATNACMMVGYSAVAALMGIRLTKLELVTSGDIDLRGFLNIDQSVVPGYELLRTQVTIAGDGSNEQIEQLHETVQKTSPNYYNLTNAIPIESQLVVE